jgi:ligand-binding sensor domain-containing protein
MCSSSHKPAQTKLDFFPLKPWCDFLYPANIFPHPDKSGFIKRITVSLIIFLFFNLTGFGQQKITSQNFSFTNVVPPQEFPFTFIYGITQDPRGYMWIVASQQLYRYDGYKFKVYMNDPSDSNSMSGIRPECVYADKKGFMWVGNLIAGLDKLDPRTGIFTHYRHNNDPASISTDSIRAIVEDHEGMLWVGTTNGLNRLDPRTGKFIHFRYDPNDPTSLSNNDVRVVYADRSGAIWAGTGCAWYGDSTKTQGGLNRFDSKTGKFIRYLHDPKDSNSLIDNRVTAICEDSKGVFWVGTAGNGLHTMDRATGKFHRHLYDPQHPDRLSRPPVKYFGFGADDYITFIREDISGAIWIGTLSSGMNRYDSKTQKLTHFESLLNDNSENTVGYFQSFSSSKDGELWISSIEGKLYRLDPLRTSLPYNKYRLTFHCFLRDNYNKLWVGTYNGLWYNNELNLNYTKAVFFLRGKNIHCLYQDKGEKLWVGADSGLYMFDYDKKSFISYRHNSGNNLSISSDTIYSILEDHNSNFWIGTTNGLNKMERKTGTFIRYINIPGDTNSLSSSFIKCILEDKHHLLWLGAWAGGGINVYDPETGKFKHYLKGCFITSIFEDSGGIVWVGTNTYLYKYDQQKDNFIKYSDEHALVDNIYVNYITEDNKNNLWVSSFIGFTKINPMRTESVTYDGNQGMDITDLLDYTGYKDKNGALYFSDNVGYYSFLPEQLMTNNIPPAIILTAFRFERNTSKNKNIEGNLNAHINDIKEIVLDYNQNNFSLDFVAFHYSHPESNKHFYMLENYDNNWHDVNNEKTASFFNIPSGKYIFRVKARSSTGVWAQKSFVIIITPPWWNHSWFWITAAVCAVGLLYILIRWRLHQKFRLS